MLDQIKGSIPPAPVIVALLAPLVLWVLVWVGIQPGEIRFLFNYEGPGLLLNRIRAVIPLVAGYFGLMVIAAHLYRRQPREFELFSPIGLLTVYGLIGVAAAALSPNIPLAFFWVGIYLSVPAVLLAVVWGSGGTQRIQHLITFNVIIIGALVTVFFILALQQLELGRQLLIGSTWSNCRITTPWFGLTWGPFDFLPLADGLLRPTGVGRFAALAGIISVGGLLGSRWRSPIGGANALKIVLWIALFGAGFLLLWTSGARTAIVSFLVASMFVVVLYGGKRIIVGGGAVAVIAIPLLLVTGIPQSLVKQCLIYSAYTPGTSLLQITPPTALAEDSVPLPGPTLSPTVAPPTNQAPAETPIASSGRVRDPLPVNARKDATVVDERGISSGFFAFSGRTVVWSAAWDFIKGSPLLGYGFHSDRLILGTHMHNSYFHALLQTGFLGFLPFVAALGLTWILLFRAILHLGSLPPVHKHLVIQAAGVIVFFSIRTIPESTGAFFGIDFLLLAPFMLYLQILNPGRFKAQKGLSS